MKKILPLLLFIPAFSFGQVYTFQYTGNAYYHNQNKGGVGADITLKVPVTDVSTVYSFDMKGLIRVNSTGNWLEFHNGIGWTKALDANTVFTKSTVGLSNVDNTSDANKPLSNAVINALLGKYNVPSGTTSQYLRGDGSLATFPTIPTQTGDLTNNSGFITSSALSPYQLISGLGTLAFSSATIPTNTNQLTNGAGYISGITLGMINSALGYTPYNGTTNPNDFLTPSSTNTLTNKSGNISQWNNDSGFVTQNGARTSISLTTVGSGAASYNNSTGNLNIPTPEIPIADYTNTVAVTSAGNAIFYLTSDKTSTGTGLYSNISFVSPLVNDSTINYTYGWSYNTSTKALTVNVKASAGLNVAALGLTLLGVPSNVANGTNVQILVKGN